jgi:hypothetical protein
MALEVENSAGKKKLKRATLFDHWMIEAPTI